MLALALFLSPTLSTPLGRFACSSSPPPLPFALWIVDPLFVGIYVLVLRKHKFRSFLDDNSLLFFLLPPEGYAYFIGWKVCSMLKSIFVLSNAEREKT